MFEALRLFIVGLFVLEKNKYIDALNVLYLKHDFWEFNKPWCKVRNGILPNA
jgi:hypothetical protein